MLQPCFNSPVCHRFSHVRHSEVKEQAGMDGSLRMRPDDNIKLDSGGKLQEVPIPGDERNTAINTALCDKSITKPCFAALGQYLRPQEAGPLPVAAFYLDSGYF